MNDIVDVLIIGAGASGAAVAWSLAEKNMRILCLEQGDWVRPSDYPANGSDWEARLWSDFALHPNQRARNASVAAPGPVRIARRQDRAQASDGQEWRSCSGSWRRA